MSQQNMTIDQPTPNYKLEIPDHLQHLLLAGFASGVIGVVMWMVLSEAQRLIAVIFLVVGVTAGLVGILLWMVTNQGARLNARRKMMDTAAWRGDEQVLDVGCGNGFLMLEAAKHLTTGKAIGIDLWQETSGGQKDQTAWRNAQLEGVSDKVDVQNVDARRMPFEAGTFDVVMSSLALHHMGSNADRERALQEMVRVLKPDGVILLYDMLPMINQSQAVMRQKGFKHIHNMGGVAMKVIAARR
ncbi:MAG: class I SAM-dependent methyltransferase [Anaerolineae bacterium]|nr:class I SAM-dependent methyltransferase [Anaerolineae bacterium]